MHDVTTGGTGTRLAFRNYKMPVAGKTGTASKNSDLWFVGYTPYYTCAVWTGFDHQFSQKNKTYQQDLWRNIMEEIHSSKQLEYKEWEKPDSIVEATICTKCGNLAVFGLCDEAEGGSCIKKEYFAKGTVPLQICDCHEKVTICTETGCRATEYCPHTKEVVYLIKEESETTLDHGGTWDTKTILPEDKDKDCPKHEDAPAPTPDPSGNDDPFLNP
jgi:penicillin-binding protein 1A